MITLEMYLMGRDKTHDCPEEVKRNAAELIEKVNRLLAHMAPLINRFPKLVIAVSSGWRPAQINAATKGAAPKSHHLTGNALDITDHVSILKDWCMANLDKLEECGLYMESPEHSPTWLHLQQLPPKSGKRVFYP